EKNSDMHHQIFEIIKVNVSGLIGILIVKYNELIDNIDIITSTSKDVITVLILVTIFAYNFKKVWDAYKPKKGKQ
ncbi:MAG TPA: hypothetical protein VLA13_02020, partial [Massilibacterium sp.]|nr:hypothetical protein [Massilibacterium sp.]